MGITIQGVAVDVDSKITFTTYNRYEDRTTGTLHRTYTGVIEAICSKQMAAVISDVNAFQTQVLKSIPTSGPIHAAVMTIDTAKFIIIRTTDDGGNSSRVAIAVPWIETIEALALTKAVVFRVYGITDAKAVDVLQLLTNSGFSVQKIG